MNYVRKLGFEETPDYDFLRELFTKVLKTLGEQEDGVFDWMLLNNGKGWEASHVRAYLPAYSRFADMSADFCSSGFCPRRHSSHSPSRSSPGSRACAQVIPQPAREWGALAIVTAGLGAYACARQERQPPSSRCLAWRLT